MSETFQTIAHPLLNVAHVREFVFATIKTRRAGLARKMTRISDDFFDAIEGRLRVHICADAQSQHSRSDGKTLKPLKEQPGPDDLPWLINQSQVHAFAQAAIRETELTQISSSYLPDCDAYLRTIITARIDSMPSVGKTIS